MTTTDEALMCAYRDGDVKAFHELMERHQVAILAFAVRFVRNRAVAEELVQDVFLQVIRSARRYEPKAKFTTWLYTLARHRCVDHLRSNKHREATMIADDMGANQITAERSAEQKRLQFALEQAIAGLADEQREVFLLREYSGLSFQEIADVIGTSENTVKSRMRYALEKLRGALLPFQDLATGASL